MRLFLTFAITIFLILTNSMHIDTPIVDVAFAQDGSWYFFLYLIPVFLGSSIFLDYYLKQRSNDGEVLVGILYLISGKYRVMGYLYSGCMLANFGYKLFILGGLNPVSCIIIGFIFVLLWLIAVHTYHCKQERGILCVYKHKEQNV